MAAAPTGDKATADSGGKSDKRKKEIYTYEAPWTIYGLGCSQRPGPEYSARFALGSFIEEYCNKVQVSE